MFEASTVDALGHRFASPSKDEETGTNSDGDAVGAPWWSLRQRRRNMRGRAGRPKGNFAGFMKTLSNTDFDFEPIKNHS